MRRDSALARAVIARLEAAGVTGVTGRALERWDALGLTTPPGTAPEGEAEHYRVLIGVMGSGRDADRAAIVLAAHGLGCARLAPVLSAIVEGPAETQLRVPAGADPSTDEGFTMAEALARQVEGPVSTSELGQQLAANWTEQTLDHAGAPAGPAEDQLHSVATAAVTSTMGDAFYAVDELFTGIGMGAPSVEARDLMEGLRCDPAMVRRLIAGSPPQVLAGAVAAMRAMLANLEDQPMVRHLDLDLVAAVMAPIVLAMMAAVPQATRDKLAAVLAAQGGALSPTTTTT